MRKQFVSVALLGCCLIASGVVFGAEEKQADDKPIQPAEVDLGRPVSFKRDVEPILENKCVSCHNLVVEESGLNLEDVESIKEGGKRGASVVPKKPEESLLYHAAARTGKMDVPAMPPLPNEASAKPVTPKELGILRQWIVEGAAAGGSGTEAKKINWQSLPSHLKAIYSVSVSPWGRFVAAGRSNRIVVYEIGTQTKVAELTDPSLLEVKQDGQPMYGPGTSHRDFVHSLAFRPDGNMLASGGYRVVKLWKRPQNATKHKFDVGQNVTAVAVGPDGKQAAIAAGDNTIKLWNPTNGKPGPTLAGHQAAVTSLAFTADGKKLVSGSKDKAFRVWNVAGGKCLGVLTTPAAVNAVTVNGDGSRIVTGHTDNLIRVWDAAAVPSPPAAPAYAKKPDEKKSLFDPLREIQGHNKPITALAAVPPESNQFVSGSQDGTVRIWDLASGNQRRAINLGAPVTAVDVRPDGQQVAAAGENGTAKVWQANNGQEQAELSGDLAATRQIARLQEDQTVAQQKIQLAENAVKAAQKGVEDRKKALEEAKKAKSEADKAVEEAKKALQEAQKKLDDLKKQAEKKPDDDGLKKKVEQAQQEVTKAKDKLEQEQDKQKKTVRRLKRAEEALTKANEELEQAQAEKKQADERKKQIDQKLEQTKQPEPKPVRAIAFSPSGKQIVTAGDDQAVRLWNAGSGEALETYSGHQGAVAALAWGPNDVILSGAADKTAVAWDANPAWTLAGRLGPDSKTPNDLASSAFVSRILALDFSPDGKLLATGGGEPSRSGELMLWNVEKQSLVREIEEAHSDTIFGLEFSRDGKYVLSGAADKFAKIHDVATGEHVRDFEGHTHHVLDVSWKADGSTIATAGADNVIKVWNTETGEQNRTIKNYNKQVTSLEFIGTGDRMISCGGDSTVRLHQSSNGRQRRAFGGASDYVYAADATRDQSVIAAGGEDGVLRLWNGENGQSIATFEPPAPEEPNVQASASE